MARGRHADAGGDQGNDHSSLCRCWRRSSLLVGWILGGKANAFAMLGALLLGVIVNGLSVAISMNSGGVAPGQRKKSFEDGFVDKDGVTHLKAAMRTRRR